MLSSPSFMVIAKAMTCVKLVSRREVFPSLGFQWLKADKLKQ